jgi:hypothetical protein
MNTTCARFFTALTLALGLAFTPQTTQAEQAVSQEPARNAHVESTVTITEENDLFTGTDNNYTNGTKVQWISGDISLYTKDHQLSKALQLFLRGLPMFLDQPGMEYNLGVTVGQVIFTPRDTHTAVYLPTQRPYAGWSYLSLALYAKTAYQLDIIETSFGIVGPSSLGGEAQNLTHRIWGTKEAQGWKHQLQDEPTLQLAWNRTLRTYRHDFDSHMAFDLLPHFGATVGNAMILANAGFEMRFGYNLPWDFGTSLIRPGSGVNAPAPQDSRRPGKDFLWGAHVFVGADGRAVARNLFLDGNTWRDSHSVTKNVLVGDVMAGVGVMLGRVKLTYTHVLRSREYVSQKSAQTFGSLGLSMTF